MGGEDPPRFRTPHVTTMITGAIVAVMAACTDLRTRAARQHRDAVRFVIVSIGVIVLRRTRPHLPRPFKVPLSPFVLLAAERAFT